MRNALELSPLLRLKVATRLKEVDRALLQQLGSALDTNSGDLHGAVPDGCSSTQGAPSGPITDEVRRAVASGTDSAAALNRGMGSAAIALRSGVLPTGTTSVTSNLTQQHPELGGQGAQMGQSSFAFTHKLSSGQQTGGTFTVSPAQPLHRHVVSPPNASNKASVPRLPYSRMQMNQGNCSGNSRRTAALPTLLDGPSSTHRPASATDDSPVQVLDGLPTSTWDGGMATGGDLTVVLSSVEGLGAALSSNENLVAVQIKVRVNVRPCWA